jgi:hypothetical protein
MKVIECGWIYTKDEFLEEQTTWPDEDMYKDYEPTKAYVIITDDGLLVETNDEEE